MGGISHALVIHVENCGESGEYSLIPIAALETFGGGRVCALLRTQTQCGTLLLFPFTGSRLLARTKRSLHFRKHSLHGTAVSHSQTKSMQPPRVQSPHSELVVTYSWCLCTVYIYIYN